MPNKLSDFVYKITTGSRKVRNILTPIGLIFFFSIITLIIIGSIELDRALKFPLLIPSNVNKIISYPILFIGIFYMSWCMLIFFRSKGTPVPLNPPAKLITCGPYKYTRNPMLTGLFTTIFGIGIYLNSVSIIFIGTPLFIIFNFIELKLIEEPELEKRLGKEYIEYKKKVPMFFP